MKCMICSNPISPFIDFGKQPIANGFLHESEFKDEYFFDMKVAFCTKCFMVQLTDQPDRSQMFHENYAFYSSSSKHMANHFEKFANDVIDRYQPKFVVEIGSNNGINTISAFFDGNIQNTRKVDVILSANVMAHIPDLHSVLRGVKNLLKYDGVLIFEDPYLGDILDKTSYDQIYNFHIMLIK